MTHPALDETELYDEPVPTLFGQPTDLGTAMAHSPAVSGSRAMHFTDAEEAPPKPIGPKPKSDSYLTAVSAAMDILSYRIILLLSVLVAGGLFGLATWSPDPWRLGAAAAFSVIVVVPLTFFYARR